MLWLGRKLQGDPGMHNVLGKFAALTTALFAMSQAHAEELAICFRVDAPPFSYLNETNEPAGYSVDLCRHVARILNYPPPELVPVTVENRFEALKEGQCSLLCGATTVTIKRREDFNFSLISFVTDTALMFPKTTSDAETLQIGYLDNTTTKDNIDTGRVTGGETMAFEFKSVESHQVAAKAILGGELAGYVADRDILTTMMANNPAMNDTHRISRVGLSYEPYALAMARKGDDQFRFDVDRALAELFRNGTALALVKEHIPSRSQDEILETLFDIQSIPK
ncbi:transporter substrate-binding domain-containing protein [Litoreibacter arenae]|uniref:transporter substrate-binding domain-containing protein n=1 Tax=Litoreibacter arenae TaxID=491388 RepID=UPI00146FE0C7|nr:transporter substrate-binding domain-containing protein [Litoreibacter arenae]